jgi:hypothetical protein
VTVNKNKKQANPQEILITISKPSRKPKSKNKKQFRLTAKLRAFCVNKIFYLSNTKTIFVQTFSVLE